MAVSINGAAALHLMKGFCNFVSGSHPQTVPNPGVRLYQYQNTPSPAQTLC